MKKKFISTTLSFLSFCGKQEFPELRLPEEKTSFHQMSMEDLEPDSFGLPWSRHIQLHAKGPKDRWLVEKQCSSKEEPWKSLGLTDKKGQIFDEDISQQKCRYKIASKLISPWQPPKSDFLLQGQQEKDLKITATRVWLPKSENYILNEHSLLIQADTVFIHGTLKSFPKKEQSGKSAGKVTVRAREIHIPGQILLSGAQGTVGPRGPVQKKMGVQGYRGLQGGKGGNGGIIELHYEHLFETPDALAVSAGLGGLGGPGGTGGPKGYRSYVYKSAHDPETRKCAIKAGKAGAQGLPGLDGVEGSIVRSQKSF